MRDEAPVKDRDLKRQAKLLHLTVVMVAIASVLNFLRLGGVFPFLFAIAGGDGGQAEGIFLLRSLIHELPAIFYLAAVWIAGGIFARVGRGEIFTVRNSKALAWIGGLISLGAAAAIAVTPPLLAWIDGTPYRFEALPRDMLLVVVGGLVQMLGLTHAKAGALRTELDEII